MIEGGTASHSFKETFTTQDNLLNIASKYTDQKKVVTTLALEKTKAEIKCLVCDDVTGQ